MHEQCSGECFAVKAEVKALLTQALLLQVLRALIEVYASEVGSREVTSLVSELLPVLIDKAGDNNTRIRYCKCMMLVIAITELSVTWSNTHKTAKQAG